MKMAIVSAQVVGITFLLLLSPISTAAERNMSESRIENLARLYRSSSGEKQRRDVCLQAIDSGVIYRGVSVRTIDRIFGTSFRLVSPSKGERLATGVIDFILLPPPSEDWNQAAHVGWYFFFSYDSRGVVEDYYLSNLHK